MSKKIIKDGQEYEYEEKVAEEDITLSFHIPNRSSEIDEKTIEKYKNSPEWKELDELYFQLLKDEGNLKEILQKIVSYGEIAIVKHNQDSFKFMEKGDEIPADFMFIPLFLDMLPEQAIDFLERRYSDDEETSIGAAIEINEFLKDYRVEELIDIISNARKAGDNEVANGAMGELMGMGEIALPQLKLKISKDIDPQFQIDLIVVALTIIFGDEDKAIELINRTRSEDETDSNNSNLELNKLINDIGC